MKTHNPRVLIVTPEVTCLPQGMGDITNGLSAKAGGLADVSAALVSVLFDLGADVHVAIPDYRSIFKNHFSPVLKKEVKSIREKIPEERIHLAEDRAFFYLHRIYSSDVWENAKVAIAFQREVINNIVPRVRPDLIHCNDWMTGLIPAMSRNMGIPCLFTVHNIYTVKHSLTSIEDRGIDAAAFWKDLYYERFTVGYEEARDSNPVDFLASGIFAAHFVNTVSPTFLKEIVENHHDFVPVPVRRELVNKWHAGCAAGILNAPEDSYNPTTDKAIACTYSARDHVAGKRANKRFLQETLGLIEDDRAPLFFWPSRLDTVQKGCRLLAEILYEIIHLYREDHLEIVFVADGDYAKYFDQIIRRHGIGKRVSLCRFNEKLARLAYAASDFVLMPSLFEPCGLPQMIGPLYGSLPVARDTGGIHDTILNMDVENDDGNGFLFETYDSEGLLWAVKQAMEFYHLPLEQKECQIERVMVENATVFQHAETALQYIDLYEKMLQRPLVNAHDVQSVHQLT